MTAGTSGSPLGSSSTTAPIDVTVGQDSGTTLPSNGIFPTAGAAPLVTIVAPVNGSEQTDNPATDSSASSPLKVRVGQTSDPNAQGSMLAINAPASGSLTETGPPSETGSLPTNVGQGTSGLPGISSGNGPLVALNAAVNGNSVLTGTDTPVPGNLGQGQNALIGPTPGPGTLVNVSTPASVTTGPAASPGMGAAVPLINIG
ncbi:MAG: hypothetical protein ACRDV6_09420 [Acidimicrobiales bacterium]